MEKELLKEINKLNRHKNDMYVVIDTLQTNLRSICSYLTNEQLDEVKTPSYKWCVEWTRNELDD